MRRPGLRRARLWVRQGLTYAIRVLAQSYAEHPAYRREWRPWKPQGNRL
ncbi:DUF6221 family protein [Streptomyces sp. NBC_00316]